MSRNIRAYLIPSEDNRRLNEFIGLVLATLAVLVGLSLVSFSPQDPSFNISRNPDFPEKAHNFIGTLGAYVSDLCLQVLGFASFVLPVALGIYAFYWLTSRKVNAPLIRATGFC
jgi:S-DNA-T family DNA segregation ATPase FtsK/SpoIIIE